MRECLLVLIKVGKDANVSKQICHVRIFAIAMENVGEGSVVVPQRTQRSGRKRKKHELQKTKTCSSNKEFLDNMMEDIKLGNVNMLEYVIICAIVLFLEANAGHSYILDVKNFYDMILSLVKTYNIMLPLTCRTLLDIEKAIRQVFSIRKGMKF